MNTTSPPEFKAVPTSDDLSRVARDMRFHPVAVENPKTLSREQIEQFNREGYIKGIRIFSAEEIAEHRRYFDDLLAKVLAEGRDSYSISTAHLKYGRVYDLLTNPRIVAAVKDILGENVVA